MVTGENKPSKITQSCRGLGCSFEKLEVRLDPMLDSLILLCLAEVSVWLKICWKYDLGLTTL